MDYKRLIIYKLQEISEEDEIFLRRIYIVIRKHVKKIRAMEQSADK